MSQSNSKIIEQNKKGSFLWEVEGGSAKMYLKGTVHILPKSFFPLRDEIMNRFDECRNYVLEVILDENEIEGIKITEDIIYNKEYIYEDGDSLYNHFSKDKVIKLRKYLVKNNICSKDIAKKFYKLKPSTVKELISNGILNKIGIDRECIGIDYYLMKRAKKMKKNILELETKEYQEELISKAFNRSEKSNKSVKHTALNNVTKELEDDKLSILDQGWFTRFVDLRVVPFMKRGGLEFLGSMYGNDNIIEKMNSKDNPLMGNRNEEMFNKIKEYLKKKDSYFVAVGAAHLIGEGGIIERLEYIGYKVNRIC